MLQITSNQGRYLLLTSANIADTKHVQGKPSSNMKMPKQSLSLCFPVKNCRSENQAWNRTPNPLTSETKFASSSKNWAMNKTQDFGMCIKHRIEIMTQYHCTEGKTAVQFHVVVKSYGYGFRVPRI